MFDMSKRKKLVSVAGLKMYFPIYTGVLRRHTGDVKAVDDVSFEIYEGETLGSGTLESYGIKEGEKQISALTQSLMGNAACCASCSVPDGAWIRGTGPEPYKKGEKGGDTASVAPEPESPAPESMIREAEATAEETKNNTS